VVKSPKSKPRGVDAEIVKGYPKAKILFDYGVYTISDIAGSLLIPWNKPDSLSIKTMFTCI
jgi:hypothetical protein